ncbi:hypothetical protein DMH25_07545 [Streptomyces sp. WAC 01325]|uniref:hypothetical protein n=1 Tax=Streptomyces sp. WAC 01325 TaxID=2203202 RepID=UPI000F86C2BA|nr:hypothetical protein DMH25_07545 [Streptomyces sp. WAC 01325]
MIEQVKDDLRSWRLGRVVTVADSGFSSEANLAYLTRAGGHYITGVKMRETSKKADAALARQGRYQEVRDNLRVKEVRLDGDPGRRWIVCHNPAEAARDAERREQQLAAISDELDASPRPAPPMRARPAPRRPRSAHARRSRTTPSTARPSARCATIPVWDAGSSSTRPPAACRSTGPRPPPRRSSTGSTCWPPPTRTCPPRTSRSATRTCWKPSVPFAR